MPGLLRMVGRTAVIAGTATTVSNRVSRRQANRGPQEDQPQQARRTQEPPPQAAAARPPQPTESRIDKLTKLGELKEQGVLTDDEFNAEKARILQS